MFIVNSLEKTYEHHLLHFSVYSASLLSWQICTFIQKWSDITDTVL